MVTESRSAVAKGHGDRRRLTAKGHKGTFGGEMKMFSVFIVVVTVV